MSETPEWLVVSSPDKVWFYWDVRGHRRNDNPHLQLINDFNPRKNALAVAEVCRTYGAGNDASTTPHVLHTYAQRVRARVYHAPEKKENHDIE